MFLKRKKGTNRWIGVRRNVRTQLVISLYLKTSEQSLLSFKLCIHFRWYGF